MKLLSSSVNESRKGPRFLSSSKVFLTVLAALSFNRIAMAQETLTLYDGDFLDYDTRIPANITGFADNTRSQFLILADDLSALRNTDNKEINPKITAVRFYTRDRNLPYPGNTTIAAPVDVYLKEVSYSYFSPSSMENKRGSTIVYQGTLSVETVGNQGEMTIEFSTPYTYNGGNLIVGIDNTGHGTYHVINFLVNSAGRGGSAISWAQGVSYTQLAIVPKTTFTYEPATDISAPTSIAVSDITTNGATVTWDDEGSSWNLRYKASTDDDYTYVNNLTSKTCTLGSLTENTQYEVGVQTVSGSLTSFFRRTVFNSAYPLSPPSNLQVTDVTATTATLSWTPGYQETMWTVKYRKSSETVWTEQTVSGTPGITLTGLESVTDYDFQVFNGDASAQGSFTTIAPYPYIQDFSGSGFPAGWTHFKVYLADIMNGTKLLQPYNPDNYNGWIYGEANGVLDGNHIYSPIGRNGNFWNYWIVSPSVILGNGAHLAFDVAYSDRNSTTPENPSNTITDDRLVVLVSKDNMSTWTILRQWDNSDSPYVLRDLIPQAQYVSIDMSAYAGQQINVAFYVESKTVEANNSNNIHIDNVAIQNAPSSEIPSFVTVSNITKNSAVLDWTSVLADEWDISVNDNDEVTGITGKPYTLTGLVPETDYTVKVRTNCGSGETSQWSNVVRFTTALSCPTPTGLACTGLTANSVTLSWTEVGTATAWEICLNDDEEHPVVANSTPFTITGLTEDQEYTAKVRAVNSPDDKSHLWSDAVIFWPTDKRVIGSYTAVNGNVPTNTWFRYSLTQQIYTKAELGGAGAIQSIDFYYAGEERTRDLDIYIVQTDKSSFSSRNDWVSVTTRDLYFRGEVTFTANAWKTITLENPFIYDGNSNIVIVIDDNTGSYYGNQAMDFHVFDAQNQSLYINVVVGTDGAFDFDPTATSGYDGYIQNVKNQIRLAFGTVPDVPRPMLLTADYTDGTEVELGWLSDATVFDISVNDQILQSVTGNPYTLSGLEYATEYTVMVRARDGNKVSEWSSPVTFTTAYSADMCTVSFDLSSTYDGWYGAAIKVIVPDDGFVLGTVTMESGNSYSTTLNVPEGKEIRFEWINGSEDENCSYLVKDHNGDLIFAGQYAMNGPVNFMVDCSSCPMPAGLTPSNSTVTGTSASLRWNDRDYSYDNYVLQLKPWTQVGKDIASTGELTAYTFDLSEYSGTGSVAIRHYDIIGKSGLLIDDIVLTGPGNDTVFSENFEVSNKYYYSFPYQITRTDLDGNGDTWEYGRYGNDKDGYGNYYFNGNGGLNSYSWDYNQGSLTPDNWLIISGVELGGSLTFVARGKDEIFPEENFGVFVCPDAGPSISNYTVTSTIHYALNLTTDTPYSWQVKGVKGENESRWVTALFKTSDNLKVFKTQGDWNVDANWEPSGVPDYTTKVRIDAPVTIPDGVLAQARKAIVGENGSIIIEDGGQLKQGASSVQVTMEKDITAGTDYIMASPLIDRAHISSVPESDNSVNNLLNGNYDFYAFDPTREEEWLNCNLMGYSLYSLSNLFKGGMLSGYGYYYANDLTKTVTYKGPAMSSYQNELRDTMIYVTNSTDEFNGWRLVGNPFTCNCKVSYSKSGVTFYKLNSSGNGFDVYAGSVVLAPGEGAFIKVTESGSVIFSSEVPASPASSSGTVYYPFLPQRGLNVHQDAGSFRLTEADGVTKLISNYQGATDVKTSFMRLFTQNVASTVCLPFPMTGVSGGTLYKFVDVTYDSTDGWVATMQASNLAETPTVANQPYLFMPGATGDVTFSGVIASVPATVTAGSTSATYSGGGDWTFQGTYTDLVYGTNLDGKVFGFAASNGDGKDSEDDVSITAGEFVRAAEGATVRPFRAYLTYSGSDEALQAPGRGVASTPAIPDRIKVRLLGSDGTVTAVGTMDMRTGDVMTGEWYDMYGRRLDGAPTGPGLYINNGRKVIIR